MSQLNQLAAIEYPDDAALTGAIKSYELAFKMQTSVPGIINLQEESQATQKLYGLDNPVTEPFGRQCLVARRLVERGFVSCSCTTGEAPITTTASGTPTAIYAKTMPRSVPRSIGPSPACCRI